MPSFVVVHRGDSTSDLLLVGSVESLFGCGTQPGSRCVRWRWSPGGIGRSRGSRGRRSGGDRDSTMGSAHEAALVGQMWGRPASDDRLDAATAGGAGLRGLQVEPAVEGRV